MSGGAGFILDMIAKIKENENLRKISGKHNSNEYDTHIHYKFTLDNHKLTDEEKQIMNQIINKQLKTNKLKNILIYSIIFIISITLLWLMYRFLFLK